MRWALALAVFLVTSCFVPFGDPIEQVWVVNDSSEPVVISVEDGRTSLVAAGARGGAYTESGHRKFVVSVMAPDCSVLTETTNAEQVLLIIVHSDRAVSIMQGANLTLLKASGSITETVDCT